MMKLLLTPQILLLLLFTVAPVRAEAEGGPAAHFSGHYRYVGGEPESREVQSAVDALVARFNPLLRGLARSRLSRNIRIPEHLTIASHEGALKVEVDDAPGFRGEAVLENGALVQRLSNFEGDRTTRYELSPDGSSLKVHVTTSSALLPIDLAYELTFARNPEGLAGGAKNSGSGS